MSLLLVLAGVFVTTLFAFSVVAPASPLPVIVALVGALVGALVVVVSVVLTTHRSGIRSEGLLGHLTQPSSPRPSWKNPVAHGVHVAEPGCAA